MAKKPLSGRCVYCLGNFDQLTRDHILPRAWYPKTTPQNLEKWKVPCCKKCNNKYSQLEKNLLVRLGLCVDPKEAKSSGITDKALRSIGPQYANKEEEKQKRERTRGKIKKEIRRLEITPTNGVLPNFGPDSSSVPPYLATFVSSDELKAFGCKLVRGITYVIDKSFIEKDNEINIFFVEDNDAKNVNQLISKKGQNYSIGPGIKVGYGAAYDKKIAVCTIEIWGKLKIYASIER